MTLCPCGSQQSYELCCAPFIEGAKFPETPEELMRSRYSAYTQAKVEYIAATMKGKAALGFDLEEARLWAGSVKWVGLRVLGSSREDERGFVEFKATYSQGNKKHYMHELSEFHLENQRWYYVDGKRR